MTSSLLTYEEAQSELNIKRRQLFNLLQGGALRRGVFPDRRMANGRRQPGVTRASLEQYRRRRDGAAEDGGPSAGLAADLRRLQARLAAQTRGNPMRQAEALLGIQRLIERMGAGGG
ncbi:MAG: hypothetical protein GXY85_05370 [Candidatus Brocadiaceae bacterium]|nr:hypothetical protein [Candidatus Brocadiaceae bacterium]